MSIFSKSIDERISCLFTIKESKFNSLLINGELFEVKVKENLKIIDLTGAGDLFAAGYLHGYINEFSPQECLDKGTDMSSKIIQQIGARI